jgi:hypothetical protein
VATVALLLACGVARPPPPHARVMPSMQAPPELASVEPVAESAVVEESPPPPPRSPYAYANIDPEDDYVVGPPDVRATCEDDLAAAGIKFKPATLPIVVQKKSKITCGAPQVVIYRGSPEKIAYQPSVMTTCTMALALARFETFIQEEAIGTFGKRVVTIHHIGTYSCREMAAYPGWVSEHSYANAIDLTDFVLEDGRTIDIYKHFKPKSPDATKKEGQFLRAISKRAFKEETFSSVLTPFFDKLHANHFHLDMARFRSDGTYFVGAE